MPTSKAWLGALTIRQLIFIAVLAVFSILLSALVLFSFSPTKTTSEGLPYGLLSPIASTGSAQA